jgi:hypothetical protein
MELLRFETSHDVTVKIKVVLPAGEWFRIDYIYFRNFGFNAGQMYPDGSFESGAFGDGTTQWEKIVRLELSILTLTQDPIAVNFTGKHIIISFLN